MPEGRPRRSERPLPERLGLGVEDPLGPAGADDPGVLLDLAEELPLPPPGVADEETQVRSGRLPQGESAGELLHLPAEEHARKDFARAREVLLAVEDRHRAEADRPPEEDGVVPLREVVRDRKDLLEGSPRRPIEDEAEGPFRRVVAQQHRRPPEVRVGEVRGGEEHRPGTGFDRRGLGHGSAPRSIAPRPCNVSPGRGNRSPADPAYCVVRESVQELSVPTSAAARSWIFNCQFPAMPWPLKAESAWAGTVRSGYSVRMLSAAPPVLLWRITCVPAGEISVTRRSPMKVCVMLTRSFTEATVPVAA